MDLSLIDAPPAGTDTAAIIQAITDGVADRLANRLVADPRALLDLAGAAARLNVSQRTVEHLVAAGEIPVVRIGLGRGVRRFDPAALDALVRRHTRTL